MLRVSLAAALLCSVSLTGTAAAALRPAEDEAAEGDEPAPGIVEARHQVEVRLVDGVAVFDVRRVLRNDGKAPGEANAYFILPAGGAVTSFSLGSEGQMRSGVLDDAGHAEFRYLELRGPGDATPKRAGLLAWGAVGGVSLRVFPVFPGEEIIVEYQVTAAVGYEGGLLRLSYPHQRDGEPAPHIVVDAGRAGAEVRVTGELLPDPDAGDGVFDITVTPPQFALLDARQGEVALAADRHLFRVEVAAAPELGALPKQARVVFVIDGSYSEGADGVAAQLQVVRGYLANVPDARFDVIIFDRKARRLAGSLVPASDYPRLVVEAARAGRLAPANGSNPVIGLAAAADALAADKGGKGPARIVLMSDRLFPFAYQPAAALAALRKLPKGTIVHAVERWPDSGELSESRIDGDDLDPVVSAWGGQILAIGGASDDREQLAHITLGLVRPIRIDDFAVEVAGAPEGSFESPDMLVEGAGYTSFQVLPVKASVTLRGRLWGAKIDRALPADAAFAAQLPALAFGGETYTLLTDLEAERVARLGGVVSPYTSYLAEEPGAEPSIIGFEEMTGCSGCCGGCSHCGGTSCRGYGVATAAGLPIDWAEQLRALFGPGIAKCGAELAPTLSVETTGDEIVGVQVTGVKDATARHCVEEAIWSVQLTGWIGGHRTWDFDLVVSSEP